MGRPTVIVAVSRPEGCTIRPSGLQTRAVRFKVIPPAVIV
jgi:hypothetical protein